MCSPQCSSYTVDAIMMNYYRKKDYNAREMPTKTHTHRTGQNTKKKNHTMCAINVCRVLLLHDDDAVVTAAGISFVFTLDATCGFYGFWNGKKSKETINGRHRHNHQFWNKNTNRWSSVWLCVQPPHRPRTWSTCLLFLCPTKKDHFHTHLNEDITRTTRKEDPPDHHFSKSPSIHLLLTLSSRLLNSNIL